MSIKRVPCNIQGLAHYLIGSDGSVLNSSTGKFVKPWQHKARCSIYLRIQLGKTRKQFYLHRLVLETFFPLGLASRKFQVDHIDGNPFNNNLSNLIWASPETNQRLKWSRMSNRRRKCNR